MSSESEQKPVFVASSNDAGQRVDNYLLKNCKQLNKASCYKLIRKGQIRINGKRIKPLQKLNAGDHVRVPPFVFFIDQPVVDIPNNVQQQLLQQVIFEDDDYLVLNKPAGLPCHTGTGHEYGVIEIITSMAAYADTQLAHRLDKDTSGCLLLAKNRTALLTFQQALKNQAVKKSYLAVLAGELIDPIEVNQALDTDNRVNGIRHVIVSENGQAAKTIISPLKRNSKYTLVQCSISTGRTHQIRVHAKHIGHSVVGDRMYGLKKPALSRELYLHAKHLCFADYQFSAPIPVEFEQVMAG
jgi:23S rRNA pseudouridine955/2504/2580 synthase